MKQVQPRSINWDAGACFAVEFQRDNTSYIAGCSGAFYSSEPSQSISVVINGAPDWIRDGEGDTTFTLYVLPRKCSDHLQELPNRYSPSPSGAEMDVLLRRKWRDMFDHARLRIGCVKRKQYSSYALDMVVGQVTDIDQC